MDSVVGEEQSILIKQCCGIPESYLGWPDPSCHGVLVDGWGLVVSVCMPVGSHLVSISVPHSSHFMFPCVYVVAMLMLHYVDISMCLQFDCWYQCAGWAWVFCRPACALIDPCPLDSQCFVLISQCRAPWVSSGLGLVRPCWWYKYWSTPSFWYGCWWMNISLFKSHL